MPGGTLIDLCRHVHTREPLRTDLVSWRPERIVLTKGCDARPDEAVYCERMIAAYPEAHVVDRRDIAHNRVPIEGADQAERVAIGKETLVLGRIAGPVSPNHDPETAAGTLCTNYHAVHPAWFCHYDCVFCYLAGSPGVSFSPTVRLFTNLQDILAAMSRTLQRTEGAVSFYVGKVQDGLQLDPIAHYSRVLVPFVEAHARAHLVFLTKSEAVEGVIAAARPAEARGRVAASWSLNAPPLCEAYEWGAPGFAARVAAARRCAETGLEVRLIFMPLLPVTGWQDLYAEAVREALEQVNPSRVTLGAICSYPCALSHTASLLGAENVMTTLATHKHGRRLRFAPELRVEMYRHMVVQVRRYAPGVPVSLCLESEDVWRRAGLDPADCRCNCIAGSCDLLHGVR